MNAFTVTHSAAESAHPFRSDMEAAHTVFTSGNEGRDGRSKLVKHIGKNRRESAHELLLNDVDVIGIVGEVATGDMLEVHSLGKC